MTSLLLLLTLACGARFTDPSREEGAPVTAEASFPTEIRQPTTLGVADTPRTDIHGTPIGVACVTCHGPDPTAAWASRDGAPFHTKVEIVHGELPCNACHDATDRTRLHLADGTTLPVTDAMVLCAQCHGPQTRDYRRGSHGGMNGYWDTRRGPRERNHCVSCHAPHAPAYAQVLPVFPPLMPPAPVSPSPSHQE